MYPTPPPAWYASGIRWIASGLLAFADVIDRGAPEPWPLEPHHGLHGGDEPLMDARHRASRAF
jgi:hypothetical protein